MFLILLNFQRQVHLNFVCNIFLIGKFCHLSVFKTFFFKVDDVYKSFYFQRMAMQMFSKIKLLNDWYSCSKLILISQIRIMHHWSKEKFPYDSMCLTIYHNFRPDLLQSFFLGNNISRQTREQFM